MKAAHRRMHFRAWIALAALLALGFGAGLAMKQTKPVEPGAFPAEAAR